MLKTHLCLFWLKKLSNLLLVLVLCFAATPCMWAQDSAFSRLYQLGPADALLVHVKDEPEIGDGPYTVDLKGDVHLPEVGVIHAAGITLTDLQSVVTERCRSLLKNPVVTISIAEYRSQRIEVLGAVGTPGVQQVRGRKTLYEVIADAGGLKPDAGGNILVTRRSSEGPLPLAGAHPDASGEFETASIDVEELLKGTVPATNIAVRPNDVITVPKAELVYVLGAVRRPGGFELSSKRNISILQALSLAEGAEHTAGLHHARILRRSTSNVTRTEIQVDLKSLMDGKSPDIALEPNDILVVPNSTAKSASYRALEAVVNTGSGVAIYHPF